MRRICLSLASFLTNAIYIFNFLRITFFFKESDIRKLKSDILETEIDWCRVSDRCILSLFWPIFERKPCVQWISRFLVTFISPNFHNLSPILESRIFGVSSFTLGSTPKCMQIFKIPCLI